MGGGGNNYVDSGAFGVLEAVGGLDHTAGDKAFFDVIGNSPASHIGGTDGGVGVEGFESFGNFFGGGIGIGKWIGQVRENLTEAKVGKFGNVFLLFDFIYGLVSKNSATVRGADFDRIEAL